MHPCPVPWRGCSAELTVLKHIAGSFSLSLPAFLTNCRWVFILPFPLMLWFPFPFLVSSPCSKYSFQACPHSVQASGHIFSFQHCTGFTFSWITTRIHVNHAGIPVCGIVIIWVLLRQGASLKYTWICNHVSYTFSISVLCVTMYICVCVFEISFFSLS